ncbi:killer toxin subunits alpha/beta [Achaetomium macrosporum]|uniref:chitinase n=1 Tax=Achaetomium macrosporum TaxID=79813 RepID=A0AAN7CA32_9PEZI|nr:killer toxin subunits alpha/beta [Achaetomium macrosporum]
MRSSTLLSVSLFAIFLAVLPAAAQECSATKKCATGCCSKFGFCGTDEEHCGEGCLSTCDFRLGCDAQNPCADGTCCSKFGFCGFGKDYCAPEVCLAGCDAKSQCDPGTFGADYVQLKKCPLNVCCSKYGYCGATAEFCGDKKVKRPSCAVDSTRPMRRVVGYYEGWAARRTCQAFMPEDVPAGVYTHLNFAFAGIDPVSFQVVPAQAEDIPLYSRLTALKARDSALKVYIALGGWTFNDPGATFHTFSQLAADEAKQRVFFASLISFMNTYDFDGVDIDWEYPVDPERGGTAADYANFPRFLQNLRAALHGGSGGRNGLTVTLPVSFWYLQHFDIVELEKWVDFFNVMSYDLHGLWDRGNKWLGAFLNAHTNMTEITEYLDLFWRNNVNPEKVTLGLAFYSRTFLAADPGCTEAQCMFDAVGEAGPCSKDEIGGTLTNAELTDQIRAAGVTPKLDKDAMVKVAVVGRKWITYDDEDTFKLKADAARKLCLGGVMVWAVSQDYTERGAAAVSAAAGGSSQQRKRADAVVYETRYSKQLQRATYYESPKAKSIWFPTAPVYQPSPNVVRSQCYWSNCGAGCPADYVPVPRLDTDASKNELMQDGGQCAGGRLRHFCCPSGKAIPKCGWFDFYNGKCGKFGTCPSGSEDILGPLFRQREVGSTQTACNNGKAQVACCETKDEDLKSLDSMRGYDVCRWLGWAPGHCDAYSYVDYEAARAGACKVGDPSRPHYLLGTLLGSGATACHNSELGWKYDQYRPLCCEEPKTDTQWLDCNLVSAELKDGNFCEASCPTGTIRLAMEKPNVYDDCKGGAHAMCCEPRFLTKATNDAEIHDGYFQALVKVLASPDKCDWVKYEEENSPSQVQARDWASPQWASDCKVAAEGTANMLGNWNVDPDVREKYMADWDRAVSSLSMSYVPASTMQQLPAGDAFSTAPSASIQTDIVQYSLNLAKPINDAKAKGEKPKAYACDPTYDWEPSPDLNEDIDDSGEEEIQPDITGVVIQLTRRYDELLSGADSPPLLARMLGFLNLSEAEDWAALHNGTQSGTLTAALGKPKRYADLLEVPEQSKNETLEERDARYQTGNIRKYTVLSHTQPEWTPDIIESAPYPNGNQGDDLIEINQDPHRYVVTLQSCEPDGYTLVTHATKAEAKGIWVSEHILELNTIGRYLTASLDGGLGGSSAIDMPMYSFERRAAKVDEAVKFVGMWEPWSNVYAISPADTCLARLGSVQHTDGLVVCDSKLNGMKTRLYKLESPVGETTWESNCRSPTPESLGRALGAIQLISAVFDYYNDANVKKRHQQVYNDVMTELNRFTKAYDFAYGGRITGKWTEGDWERRWWEFMLAHFLRVESHTRIWLQNKLNGLDEVWHEAFARCGSDKDWCAFCIHARKLIRKHWDAVTTGQHVKFDFGIFEKPRFQVPTD